MYADDKFVYIYEEKVDFGESDKIKKCGKMDKSNAYHKFTGNILFFIHRNSSNSEEVLFHLFLSLYIYIYKDGCWRSKERTRIYSKIGRSTKRFVCF